MTKYILHGGYTSTPNQLNNEFFARITEDLRKNSQVLIVYFARNEADYDKFFGQDKKNFLDNSSSKELKLVVASKENFLERIKQSDAIYIRGGNALKLLDILKQYPGFAEAIKEKVVAGSSAGAYVLSKYFFSNDADDVFEGLGILPIAIICHYKGEETNLERLKERSKDLEIVILKDFEYRIFQVE